LNPVSQSSLRFQRQLGRSRALTFMELLIALSITAVVCGILAVLINATAVGTSNQNDGRRSLVRLQSVKSVLEDEFVNARAILAIGTNYVVYWTGDQPGAVTPANGAVNLSELRLLEVDTATNTLKLYSTTWPAGFSNSNIISNDTSYAAGTSWYSAAVSAKGSYFAPVTLGSATSLTASLDNATPTLARLVHVTIILNDGSVTRRVVLATALASPGAPW